MQTYIMKLARSGEDGEKVHIVLESGVRFHTTQVRPDCACPKFFECSGQTGQCGASLLCFERPGLLVNAPLLPLHACRNSCLNVQSPQECVTLHA